MIQYLFERLSDSPLAQDAGSREGRREMVVDNVQRLISSLRASIYNQADVLGLALPAVVDLDKDSNVHRQRFAAALRGLIERYEPRLSDVRVSVRVRDSILTPFSLSISACLREGEHLERFQFTTKLQD